MNSKIYYDKYTVFDPVCPPGNLTRRECDLCTMLYNAGCKVTLAFLKGMAALHYCRRIMNLEALFDSWQAHKRKRAAKKLAARRTCSVKRPRFRRTVSRANTARRASSFVAAPSHDDSGGDGGGSDDGGGQSNDDHHSDCVAAGLQAHGKFVLLFKRIALYQVRALVSLFSWREVNGRFFVPFHRSEVSA